MLQALSVEYRMTICGYYFSTAYLGNDQRKMNSGSGKRPVDFSFAFFLFFSLSLVAFTHFICSSVYLHSRCPISHAYKSTICSVTPVA